MLIPAAYTYAVIIHEAQITVDTSSQIKMMNASHVNPLLISFVFIIFDSFFHLYKRCLMEKHD